jgi:hypothetical protein
MQAVCARHGAVVAWTAIMTVVALVLGLGSLIT